MAKQKSYTPKGCTHSITDQIKEIDRELRVRRRVYEQLIKDRKMDRETANRQYARLRNAKKSLELLEKIMAGKNQASLGLPEPKQKNKNKFEPEDL